MTEDWEGLDAADFVVGEDLVLFFESVDFGQGLFGCFLIVLYLQTNIIHLFLELLIILP